MWTNCRAGDVLGLQFHRWDRDWIVYCRCADASWCYIVLTLERYAEVVRDRLLQSEEEEIPF